MSPTAPARPGSGGPRPPATLRTQPPPAPADTAPTTAVFSSIGTVTDAATVYGVHGAAGRTRWKCFAGRRQLASPTEAVEWASIPPGGLSGEHRHTRTEEIYLILRGQGEFLFNGRSHPVAPGSLALTAPGNVHGLRNTCDTDLDWWVIETLAPGTGAVLSGADHTPEVPAMGDIAIHDLFEERTVSTAGVFTGPLKSVDVTDLDAGRQCVLGRPDAELAVFVHSGDGRVRAADGTTVQLAADTCVTFGAGTTNTVQAGSGLRLLIVTLAVPQHAAEAK
ncbi:cupin domain-containing protein [Streptomyces panaciradicis]|uniref:cupin domain-containing protein n=1 Tax=Streptomyces panaciradicis TaxID=1470261 RepID=UPI00201D02FC|nr:cupin domain-containing protein [Streptomyces panaciradicis]MCL6670493.1 cupin domain-containing protein [Streptomyces panaciradicis]